jgi:type IV pilus assembly protein PilB
LQESKIDKSTLQIIPQAVASAQQSIAFKQDQENLHVAMVNPQQNKLVEMLQKKTGLKVKIYYTTKQDLSVAMQTYEQAVEQIFADIIAENVSKLDQKTDADPPIIKIIDTIIEHGYKQNASDIHIEPLEEATLVRFRLDGIMHDILKLPTALFSQMITRIKVMAALRTDEHQAPQDGKIGFKLENGDGLDIRVSITATTNGEKVVMRLLSEKARNMSLEDLGFNQQDLSKVNNAHHNAHGMILVTGPTGSGKTTTLYAILKLLNKREINIMTIEDPVEYDIDSINQIQVNPKADVTFAKGLRSIVRQDPDVILVGEIRDEETASIAINSAMTGHLVLSSLHTNDAATSFPRLMDMKIEPYLIASTVNLIVAQRLVRKICNKCKSSLEITAENLDGSLKKYFSEQEKYTVYKGKGCPVCHDSGYNGRIGIFEILEVGEELKKLIGQQATASDLQKLAKKQGMTSMLEDGIGKVKQGITTIEELLRVTKES